MYFIEVVGWLMLVFSVFLLIISIRNEADRAIGLPFLGVIGMVLSLVILLYAVPEQRKLDDRIENMVEQIERIENGE